MPRVSCGLLLLALHATSALYADQVGEVDWYKAHVGTVQHADFHTANGRRLALISTDIGIVAALDANSGETVWRQPLPADEAIFSQAFSARAGTLLVGSLRADGAAIARAWSLGGELLWDTPLAPPAAAGDGAAAAWSAPPAALGFVGEAAAMACALWGNTVTLLDARTGALAWAWAPDAAGGGSGAAAVRWDATHATADGETLVVYGHVGARHGSALARVELALAGDGAGGPPRPAAGARLASTGVTLLETEQVIVTLEPRFVVTLDGARGKLVFQADGADGAHAAGSVRTAPLAGLGGGAAGGARGEARLLPLRLPGAVVVAFGAGLHVLVDLTTGEPHARWEARTAGAAALATLGDGAQAVLTLVAAAAGGADGALEARAVLVTAGGAEELPPPVGLAVPSRGGANAGGDGRDGGHGGAALLFLSAFAKGRDGGVTQRALLVTEDGCLHGLASGGPTADGGWSREESLARPLALAFLNLPTRSDAQAQADGPQYGQLPRRLLRAVGLGGAAKPAALPASRLVGDAFGFRKLLLVSTAAFQKAAAAQITALHSEDGAVAWRLRPTKVGGARVAGIVATAVVPAPNGLETDVQLVLALADDDDDAAPAAGTSSVGASAGARHAVVTYDGFTGLPRGAAAALSGRVRWSAPVPSAAAGAPPVAHAFVVARPLPGQPAACAGPDCTGLALELVPDSAEARARFDAAVRPTAFWFALDAPSGQLSGYGFARAGPEGGGSGFVVALRWRYVAPAGAQDVTLATLDPSERVHSAVTVLGDRSILHKYLNRNLLALGYTTLAATATAPKGPGTSTSTDEGVAPNAARDAAAAAAASTVHVALVDGVSGSLVHAYAQPRSAGPLRLALCENGLAASARALPGGMTTVSVVQLYANASAPNYARMLLSGMPPRPPRLLLLLQASRLLAGWLAWLSLRRVCLVRASAGLMLCVCD
jgi:outer membrane protein assembly factor BamB